MSDKNIELREIVVTKKDGTTETVFVAQDALEKKKSWKDHLPIVATSVGIAAALCTIYFTYLQIRKTKSNG
jgi:hypothetical protein